MIYGLKEGSYMEDMNGEIQIIAYIPKYITLVATPDDRIWRVKHLYGGFSTLGTPITIT